MDSIISCRINRLGNHNFYVEHNGKQHYLFTQDYHRGINLICIGLGGLETVPLMTGTQITGAIGDLEKATALITSLMDNGLYGVEFCDIRMNVDSRIFSTPRGKQNDKRVEKTAQLLQKYEEKTLNLISNGKKQIEVLATALMENAVLSGSEIKQIIEKAKE